MNVLFLLTQEFEIQLIKSIERKIEINYHVISFDTKDYNLNNFSCIESTYLNIIQIVDNYLNNKDLQNNLSYSENIEKNISFKNYLNDLVEKYFYFDVVCFSVYERFLEFQIFLALSLKQKKNNIKILFGGPEIIVNKKLHKLCSFLNIDWSTQDVDQSIYDYIYDINNFYNKDHKSFFKDLTINDYPKYNKKELDILNNTISLYTTKGCVNNCYFCNNPLPGHYDALSRNILIDWIDSLENEGVKNIFFSDAYFNINGFNLFLEEKIKRNNKIKFQDGICFSINNIDINQCEKIKRAGFNGLMFGIECMSEENKIRFNKKMKSYNEIESIIRELIKNEINVVISTIYNFPNQSKESLYEELDFIFKLKNKYNIFVKFNEYFLTRDSFIYNNYRDYNIELTKINIPDNLKYLQKYFDIENTQNSIIYSQQYNHSIEIKKIIEEIEKGK